MHRAGHTSEQLPQRWHVERKSSSASAPGGRSNTRAVDGERGAGGPIENGASEGTRFSTKSASGRTTFAIASAKNRRRPTWRSSVSAIMQIP
jgi:hypothetical protein